MRAVKKSALAVSALRGSAGNRGFRRARLCSSGFLDAFTGGGYVLAERFARLLLSYLVVPPVSTLALFPFLIAEDWSRWKRCYVIVAFYGVFALAAMIVFGTPLLCLYVWRRWTGFAPFVLGGGLCAFTTTALVTGAFTSWTSGDLNTGPLSFWLSFTGSGLLGGFVFRLILFGGRRHGED